MNLTRTITYIQFDFFVKNNEHVSTRSLMTRMRSQVKPSRLRRSCLRPKSWASSCSLGLSSASWLIGFYPLLTYRLSACRWSLLGYSSYPSSSSYRRATSSPRGRIFISSYKQLLAMEYQNTCSSSQITSQFRHTFIRENVKLWNRKSIKICFRVTRTLFAFAEMTNMDPGYAGPEFDFDKIIKELMIKVKQSFVVL